MGNHLEDLYNQALTDYDKELEKNIKAVDMLENMIKDNDINISKLKELLRVLEG